MAQQILVDPATNERTVREAIRELTHGNAKHARVLALRAGANAGVLGLGIDKSPFHKPSQTTLHEKWMKGRAYAVRANDNKEPQRSFL